MDGWMDGWMDAIMNAPIHLKQIEKIILELSV